jgi:hypothetical protein
LLLAACAALAACGSSHGTGSSVDPASVSPASAVLFAGATVRPEGQQKSDAQAAGRALTHQANPYQRLLAALQTPGSPPLTLKDIESWLGPHAGVFLTSLHASGPAIALVEAGLLGGGTNGGPYPFGTSAAQGAIVLNTSDSNAAHSFLEGQAKRAGAHSVSYRGISYEATNAGLAFAIVQHLAVIGSESGVHAVIDTSLGGPSLAHAPDYSKLLSKAPSDALAHLYTTAPAATATAGGGEGGVSGLLRVLSNGRTANISLIASPSSFALDADALVAPGAPAAGGLLSADPQAAEGVALLPADSWLAIGLGHVGATLPDDVAALESLSSLSGSSPAEGTTFGLQALLGALTVPLAKLGAKTPQAKHDYQSWMGPAGIFASGSGLLDLRAAAVIASTDAAASRAAVGKLGAQLKQEGLAVVPAKIPGAEAAIGVRLNGLPLVLDIVAARDSTGQPKFALALGEASAVAAINPEGSLPSTPAYSQATATIGEGIKPTLLVNVPTLLGLLEGVGLAADPTISKFVPYLQSVASVIGGGHELDSETTRYRLLLGLGSSSGADQSSGSLGTAQPETTGP